MSAQPDKPTEKKGLRKAIFEMGSKAGMKKELLDYFSHLLENPADYEGYKKILIYKGDYVRTYQFMISMLHSQSRIEQAYDAKLGMIRAVSEARDYLPIYGLDEKRVASLGKLRDGIGDIEAWLNSFYNKTVFGHGVETADYRNLVSRGNFHELYPVRVCNNPKSLLREIKHDFHREVDRIMPDVDKAIFPLASSHRQPGPSGGTYGEYGPFGPETGGGGDAVAAQVAMAAVTAKPAETGAH